MKKGLWRYIFAVVSIAAILTTPMRLVSADTNDDQLISETSGTSGNEIEKVYETDEACLYFNADTTVFCVENKATGYRWSSAPSSMETDGTSEYVRFKAYSLLYLEYYNYATDTVETVYSYENAVQTGNYTYKTLPNGVMLTFTFADAGITVPLSLQLEGDSLTATVDTDNITYDAAQVVPLQLHLVPYMCSGNSGDSQGYVLIPDGSGALVSFSSNKLNASTYSKPVYGKDVTVDTLDDSGILLPCYGANDGRDSLLVVISEDEENAYIHCEGRGEMSDYTHAWTSFKLLASMTYQIQEGTAYSTKVYEDGGIKAEKLAVSYYVLDSDKSGYAAMAERYRQLLFSEEELAAASVQPALYMDVYATVQKVKSILGFQITYDSVITSTDDVARMVEELSARGVDSTVVKYNAWNKQENAGIAVTKAASKKSVGNIADMIAEMQAVGCSVYPSVNRMMTYEKSRNPFHSMTSAVRDLSSTLVFGEKERYVTTSYLLKYKTFDKNVNKLFSNFTKKGIAQVAVDDIANVLYSDFADEVVKRDRFVELIDSTLNRYTQSNKLMCTTPNAYAAVYADEIMELPSTSSGHIIFDQDVPFLQLVYSGVVRYGGETINLSGNPEKAFLKALETGSMPCYAWVGKNSDELIHTKLDYLFSADYTAWLDEAADQYEVLKEIETKCENTPMVNHAILADGVTASYYANGMEVIVNYNDTAVTLADGSTVDAKAFITRKGA